MVVIEVIFNVSRTLVGVGPAGTRPQVASKSLDETVEGGSVRCERGGVDGGEVFGVNVSGVVCITELGSACARGWKRKLKSASYTREFVVRVEWSQRRCGEALLLNVAGVELAVGVIEGVDVIS